ncbi:MAG: type II toxin-antitoxin system RelE/ParE family toxin [Nitrososphaerales archaeon]
MIRSFADPDTERIFHREPVKRFSPELQRRALRSLGLIHTALTLDDLRTPPGNRLEPLKGDRAGQHSIRINEQWRVCFVWRDSNAYGVEIVGYH